MYVFKKIKNPDNKFDRADIIMKVDTENLDDLLDYFEYFLRASGYSFKGEVDIVEHE